MSLDTYRKAVQVSEEINKKLEELDDLVGCFESNIMHRVGLHVSEFRATARAIELEASSVEHAAFWVLTGKMPK